MDNKMCSPPLLEAYFARLLRERNLTVSTTKVEIVSDNAQLSKTSHESASRMRRSLSSTKKCRWDSSPTLTLRKHLNGGHPRPVISSHNATWEDQPQPPRRLLKSDKWGGTCSITKNTRLMSSSRVPPPPQVSRSLSQPNDPVIQQPPSSKRRSASLADAPMMLPMRKNSFSFKSKSLPSLDKVSIGSKAA